MYVYVYNNQKRNVPSHFQLDMRNQRYYANIHL